MRIFTSPYTTFVPVDCSIHMNCLHQKNIFCQGRSCPCHCGKAFLKQTFLCVLFFAPAETCRHAVHFLCMIGIIVNCKGSSEMLCVFVQHCTGTLYGMVANVVTRHLLCLRCLPHCITEISSVWFGYTRLTVSNTRRISSLLPMECNTFSFFASWKTSLQLNQNGMELSLSNALHMCLEDDQKIKTGRIMTLSELAHLMSTLVLEIFPLGHVAC